MAFADKVRITVISGKGGDGHVSFRREKYVPNGGPDGGDGGNGGSIILEVDEGVNTLSAYRHNQKFKAEPGEDGRKKKQAGKKGNDLVLKLPKGTLVKEAESGKVIVDLSGDTKRFVLLKGGHGGNGNQHYATSTMQAPKYAQPGQPARELNLLLELKLIADVGLVGFPNVGKSTLLSESTNARPKVADYHFTTLAPMLGVVDLDDERSFVMADIPGLIEGAAEGAGLGHDFLQHIERTRVLIHVIDAAGLEGRDPLNDIDAINAELAKYNADLTKKKQILAANKTDLLLPEEEEEILQRLHEKLDPLHVPVFSISAATGKGVRDLLSKAHEIVSTQEEDSIVYAQEYDPEEALTREELPFTVTRDKKTKDFLVEGPRVERMLGYTNLETEKGFMFFQKFIEENGIADELKALGIREGDTVRIYGHAFEYYDS
ncbi:MAG: GTPase ObgE [Lachnospiraceae bacterium]|nr:GTPase ObgE [Lachnospiraceae bacterium]